MRIEIELKAFGEVEIQGMDDAIKDVNKCVHKLF